MKFSFPLGPMTILLASKTALRNRSLSILLVSRQTAQHAPTQSDTCMYQTLGRDKDGGCRKNSPTMWIVAGDRALHVRDSWRNKRC